MNQIWKDCKLFGLGTPITAEFYCNALEIFKSYKEYDSIGQKLDINIIPDEINIHHEIFGKDSFEVDYDEIGPCPFCDSRIDEFNFCACGGNLGVS
jgi:hypothetical protein